MLSSVGEVLVVAPMASGIKVQPAGAVARIGLVACDAATRLSVLAALLSLPRDAQIAVAFAGSATALTAARAWLRARRVTAGLSASFDAALRGIVSMDAHELASRREDEQGVATLLDAVYEVGIARSLIRPELEGAALAVLGIAVIGVWRFGLVVSALGLAAVVVLIGLTTPLRRLGRRARERSWRALKAAAASTRTLLEAAIELRAQGAERTYAGLTRVRVGVLADAEGAALRSTGWLAVLPGALTVVAALVPTDWIASIAGAGLDLAVLGGAGASSALGLIGALDQWQRGTTYRQMMDEFSARSDPGERSRQGEQPAGRGVPVEVARVRFESVSLRHPGATRCTPAELSFDWSSGGLALLGENGAGKSSSVLALLGLVEPCEGNVRIEDSDGSELPAEARGVLVAYVPQRPHIEPGESVQAHLDLFGTRPAEPARTEAALESLGLAELLRRRGGGSLEMGLALPMGTLSGGERQKVAIARALASTAALLVLDEPEAGLDAESRVRLRALLEKEAHVRKVLLVAHDPSLVLEGFALVRCEAEAAAGSKQDSTSSTGSS